MRSLFSIIVVRGRVSSWCSTQSLQWKRFYIYNFYRWFIYHLGTQFHILPQRHSSTFYHRHSSTIYHRDTVSHFIARHSSTIYHKSTVPHFVTRHSSTFYHRTQFNILSQRHGSTFYHRNTVSHFITRHSSTIYHRDTVPHFTTETQFRILSQDTVPHFVSGYSSAFSDSLTHWKPLETVRNSLETVAKLILQYETSEWSKQEIITASLYQFERFWNTRLVISYRCFHRQRSS